MADIGFDVRYGKDTDDEGITAIDGPAPDTPDDLRRDSLVHMELCVLFSGLTDPGRHFVAGYGRGISNVDRKRAPVFTAFRVRGRACIVGGGIGPGNRQAATGNGKNQVRSLNLSVNNAIPGVFGTAADGNFSPVGRGRPAKRGPAVLGSVQPAHVARRAVFSGPRVSDWHAGYPLDLFQAVRCPEGCNPIGSENKESHHTDGEPRHTDGPPLPP